MSYGSLATVSLSLNDLRCLERGLNLYIAEHRKLGMASDAPHAEYHNAQVNSLTEIRNRLIRLES